MLPEPPPSKVSLTPAQAKSLSITLHKLPVDKPEVDGAAILTAIGAEKPVRQQNGSVDGTYADAVRQARRMNRPPALKQINLKPDEARHLLGLGLDNKQLTNGDSLNDAIERHVSSTTLHSPMKGGM